MIETSSLPERDEESTMLGTPSRVVTRCTEENQENIVNLNEASFPTPTKKDSVLDIQATVSARREWLNNFATRNSHHVIIGNHKDNSESHQRNTLKQSNVNQAPKFSTDAKSIQSNVTILRSTNTVNSVPLPVKRNFTPRKTKTVHSGIEATDDGYASVATLSQWLASNPTSKKTNMNVRRGRNVSYKSRKFDRGQESAIARENHIQRGSVNDKKNWLKNAFQHMDEEPVDELTSRLNTQYAKSELGVYDPSATRYARSEIVTSRPSTLSVAAKKDWLNKAFKSTAEDTDTKGEQREDARSMVITDDAASRLSVSDKKSWLQSAFKKSEEIHSRSLRNTTSHFHPSAVSDIAHSRGKSRDEIAARAKQRFLQGSNRGVTAMKNQVKQTTANKRASLTPETDVMVEGGGAQQSRSEPTANNGSIVEPTKNPIRQVVVEEDRTPVNFRAAREFLVQRTSQNSNKDGGKNGSDF